MAASSSMSRSKAYTDAGVDINAGNTLVERIKKMVSRTHTPGVLSGIGGFGGLFRPDCAGMKAPVLVSSTDGVGTKLKLAFEYNQHGTIGIDLVAMSVNDILVQGAKPLFFLDYFATGKLDVDVAETVIKGVAEGCKQAHCALLGGETAEMPDMYAPGEYDLAGFCVGIVDQEQIIDGTGIREGDVLIGLSSSGIHSNGYSLARKIVAQAGLAGTDIFPGTQQRVQDVLLAPTTIYVDCITKVLASSPVKGMVHVTGGGFYDNIPRVLPDGLAATIDFGSWDMLPVFTWLQQAGNLTWPEMLQIFNCSIGYVLIVQQDAAPAILAQVQDQGISAWQIGNVVRQQSDTEAVVVRF